MEALVKNILRLLQLFWALLLTALVGNVIASNVSAAGTAEAAVNFAMFAVVVGWLAALFGLASHYVDALASAPTAVALGLDGAATLFSGIAGIVLAAKLRAVNCGSATDLDPKSLGDDWIGFGSADDQKRCRELQASTAFMWFLFLCFVVSLLFTLRGWRRVGGGGGGGGGSAASPRGARRCRICHSSTSDVAAGQARGEEGGRERRVRALYDRHVMMYRQVAALMRGGRRHIGCGI